jgi:membrane protein DedA with SNARE-associated domain/rhodanese-related sulfurtransferase
LDQGGLPVPAYPPIIITSALAFDAQESVLPILIVATLASLISDFLWFQGGRRFGAALLRLMCKLSLSPDSCVGQTRQIYARWGAPSLIAAKFIPGFAALATTLAGQSGTSTRRFVFFDGIGAALWTSGAVALGIIFHSAVNEVLEELESLGRYALVVLIGALLAFAASKWWKRRQFMQVNRMERISIDELKALIDGGSPPAILDVRPPEQRQHYGWIAGDQPAHDAMDLPIATNTEVVVYCDCPNEASAAVFARKLKAQGFVRVRPLAGGLEAWRAKGYPVDQASVASAPDVATLQVL